MVERSRVPKMPLPFFLLLKLSTFKYVPLEFYSYLLQYFYFLVSRRSILLRAL